ncbi:MAG: bifunctional phosphoribosylaminoimidazolecarboxamide formyltransferase/IMP cyclohydrolase PurH, partial [Alphaproteobacteria bacterium]
REVSEITGFPEMMDGRVKTLHPRIHGGLLGLRDAPAHVAAMEEHGIPAIDLLVLNLYPFERTVLAGADESEAIENIDIGGPAMIRSAAKNHRFVAVVTDPVDYPALEAELEARDGATGLDFRRRMAARAFRRTAAYDAAIANWFAEQLSETFPERLAFAGERAMSLRYGENPHQQAALYLDPFDMRPGAARARQLQGKALSYNNLNDTDAAFELVAEFADEAPTVAIIKHANPCGMAQADSLVEAYRKALKCDPVSAFGGIVAMNRPLDAKTAEEIVKVFTEVIIAPEVSEEAKAIIAAKKNLRLLETGAMPDPTAPGLEVRRVAGGFLVQTRDNGRVTRDMLKVVTRRAPDERELADMLFAFRVVKHVKSNAIVYVRDRMTVGIGAGQMNRRDSSRIAAIRAREAAEMAGEEGSLAQGSVVASDAFFPFADGLLEAARAGATAVIQPGGSIRDEEVIAAADEAGLAMVFTGMRHFRH